jgi:hypothetical protein
LRRCLNSAGRKNKRQTESESYSEHHSIPCAALGAGKALAELPVLQRSVPDM